MTTLPVELWLSIFHHIDTLNSLWTNIRNASRHLRLCVDEYFRRSVLPNSFLELQYSDLNRHGGPTFSLIRIPMLLGSISDDGVNAEFVVADIRSNMSGNDAQTRDPNFLSDVGSVWGWVPFIRRYCNDTQKPKPVAWTPLHCEVEPEWEEQYPARSHILVDDERSMYLKALRMHTSIGRGDRPPYYLKIGDHVNDTELVGLEINCHKITVSFDWCRTLSAFFMEKQFESLADKKPPRRPGHDTEIDIPIPKWAAHGLERYSNTIRARRKRIQPWVERHKDRMTLETRQEIEGEVRLQMFNTARHMNYHDLCAPGHGEPLTMIEYEHVPYRCGSEPPELWAWRPSIDELSATAEQRPSKEGSSSTVEQPLPRSCPCCVVI